MLTYIGLNNIAILEIFWSLSIRKCFIPQVHKLLDFSGKNILSLKDIRKWSSSLILYFPTALFNHRLIYSHGLVRRQSRPVPAVGSHDNRRNNRKGASIARRRLNTSGITFPDLEPRSCTRATVSRSLINTFRDGAKSWIKDGVANGVALLCASFPSPFPSRSRSTMINSSFLGSLINHPWLVIMAN